MHLSEPAVPILFIIYPSSGDYSGSEANIDVAGLLTMGGIIKIYKLK